jgi:hypothetical protein
LVTTGSISRIYGEYIKDLPGVSGVLSGILIKIMYIYIFPVNISVKKTHGKVTGRLRGSHGEAPGGLRGPLFGQLSNEGLFKKGV